MQMRRFGEFACRGINETRTHHTRSPGAPRRRVHRAYDLEYALSCEFCDGLKNALTPLQREVYPLLVQGLSNTEMGERLNRSAKSIQDTVTAILKKKGVNGRSKLIADHYARVISKSQSTPS